MADLILCANCLGPIPPNVDCVSNRVVADWHIVLGIAWHGSFCISAANMGGMGVSIPCQGVGGAYDGIGGFGGDRVNQASGMAAHCCRVQFAIHADGSTGIFCKLYRW